MALTKDQTDIIAATQVILSDVQVDIAAMATDGTVEGHKVSALNKLRAAINTLTEA